MTLIEAWQALQDAAPYIVAVLAATTALAHVLQRAAHALDRWAAASAATWDDEPASVLARAMDAFVRALDWVSALLPRIGFGRLDTSASAAAKRRAERAGGGRGRGGGAAVMLLAAAIAASSSLTSGCGASALAVQADTAAAAGTVWTEADTALLRLRAAELDGILEEARDECGPDGCTPEQAERFRARLQAAEEAWAPVLACRAPVPEALRAWVDAVELAHTAATEELGLAHAAAGGARFVLVYQSFAHCIEAARPGTDVPMLPSTVEALASGVAQ